MATPLDIASSINALKTAFPNYQPDIMATADLWKTIFADMDGETLKTAVLVCLTEKRAFAPSAGEIRVAALDLHAKASGIPDAYFAYDEVCKMPGNMIHKNLISIDGVPYIEERELKFSHPLIEKVARLMGWPKTFPTDMPAADRSQFVKAYEAEVGRYVADAGMLPAVQHYIEAKSETMRGNAPALMGSLIKKLGA